MGGEGCVAKELDLKQHDIRNQIPDRRLLNCQGDVGEFKGICDGLATIHKHVDEDSKVINFASGLGFKGFDMREDEE
ncbi:hypothetical protein KY284_008042 [Solanum tuberosum]|nr:hypothetical protein KY284_008042 [Solanum tuberosum]